MLKDDVMEWRQHGPALALDDVDWLQIVQNSMVYVRLLVLQGHQDELALVLVASDDVDLLQIMRSSLIFPHYLAQVEKVLPAAMEVPQLEQFIKNDGAKQLRIMQNSMVSLKQLELSIKVPHVLVDDVLPSATLALHVD